MLERGPHGTYTRRRVGFLDVHEALKKMALNNPDGAMELSPVFGVLDVSELNNFKVRGQPMILEKTLSSLHLRTVMLPFWVG